MKAEIIHFVAGLPVYLDVLANACGLEGLQLHHRGSVAERQIGRFGMGAVVVPRVEVAIVPTTNKIRSCNEQERCRVAVFPGGLIDEFLQDARDVDRLPTEADIVFCPFNRRRGPWSGKDLGVGGEVRGIRCQVAVDVQGRVVVSVANVDIDRRAVNGRALWNVDSRDAKTAVPAVSRSRVDRTLTRVEAR